MKTKTEVTFSINKLHLFAFFVSLIGVLLFVLPYYLLWKDSLHDLLVATYKIYFLSSLALNVTISISVIILSLFLHELIHGLTWSFFTKNKFKDIVIGVQWKTCTLYCHCKTPLKNKYYILGAIMPFLLLGAVPSVIAIASGSLLFLLFGLFFVVSASGDIFIVMKLLQEDLNSCIEDHPNKAGYYIYNAQ